MRKSVHAKVIGCGGFQEGLRGSFHDVHPNKRERIPVNKNMLIKRDG